MGHQSLKTWTSINEASLGVICGQGLGISTPPTKPEAIETRRLTVQMYAWFFFDIQLESEAPEPRVM